MAGCESLYDMLLSEKVVNKKEMEPIEARAMADFEQSKKAPPAVTPSPKKKADSESPKKVAAVDAVTPMPQTADEDDAISDGDEQPKPKKPRTAPSEVEKPKKQQPQASSAKKRVKKPATKKPEKVDDGEDEDDEGAKKKKKKTPAKRERSSDDGESAPDKKKARTKPSHATGGDEPAKKAKKKTATDPEASPKKKKKKAPKPQEEKPKRKHCKGERRLEEDDDDDDAKHTKEECDDDGDDGDGADDKSSTPQNRKPSGYTLLCVERNRIRRALESLRQKNSRRIEQTVSKKPSTTTCNLLTDLLEDFWTEASATFERRFAKYLDY